MYAHQMKYTSYTDR